MQSISAHYVSGPQYPSCVFAPGKQDPVPPPSCLAFFCAFAVIVTYFKTIQFSFVTCLFPI